MQTSDNFDELAGGQENPPVQGEWHAEAKRRYYYGEIFPLRREYLEKLEALNMQGLSPEDVDQKAIELAEEYNQKLAEHETQAAAALVERTAARREQRS